MTPLNEARGSGSGNAVSAVRLTHRRTRADGRAHAMAGQPRAFTLIELLVVVAIIALLIAILMPSLANARQLAHSTTCAASIRQLGIGMHTYLQQYGTFPAHQFKLGSVRIRWWQAMTRELKGYTVSSCPTVPDWEVGRNNAYGYNYKYIGSGRENLVGPTAPYERHPVKSVRAPSSTIAFGDSDGTGWTKPHRNIGNDNDVDMLGNHGYILDPTYIPTFSLQTTDECYAWMKYRTYISTRHLGKSNLVFADGHGERLTPKQVYQNNKFWNGLGGEDPVRDDHVPYRFLDGEWRFPDI